MHIPALVVGLALVAARGAYGADLPALIDLALEPLPTAAAAVQQSDRATAAAHAATVSGLAAAVVAGAEEPGVAASLGRKGRAFKKRIAKLRTGAGRAAAILRKPRAKDAVALRALARASKTGLQALRMLAPTTLSGIVVLEDNPRATGFHTPGEAVDLTVIARDDAGSACGEPFALAVENLSAATAVDTTPTALGDGRFRVTMGTQGGVARLAVTACGRTAAPGRLLFNAAPPPGGGGDGQWVLAPVTAGSTVGFFPQIALDAGGAPHVVSLNYASGAEAYEYATRGPGGWTTETISTAAQNCGGNVGVLGDIVVDDAGLPHVSLEIPDQAIQHGVRTGGWTVEDVSTTLCPFSGPSDDQAFAFVGHNAIAADRANDTIWIVGWFWDGVAQAYAVAAWETGDVSPTQIDRGSVGGDTYTGRHPSVAVESAGVAHVAWEGYAGPGESLIRHARWNGSSFNVDTVATMGGANSGKTAVVAVDGTGRPHVVYFHPGEGYKHAAWNGAGWDVEVITTDTAAAGQAWMDVAVDGSERLHVVYSRSDGDVRYTRGTAGAWSAPEAIAQDGDNPTLAVTSAGTPHIVFRDPSADQLVHATR